MPLPARKPMDHTLPSWVKGSPIYFITICTSPRGLNQLCHPELAAAVFSAARHYHIRYRWHVSLLLLMHDHLHALIAFPKIESAPQVIRSWKHYLSKQRHLKWQRDYFDHRVRDHSSLREKAAYIRQNPVRAGLVASPELWPYIWEPER